MLQVTCPQAQALKNGCSQAAKDKSSRAGFGVATGSPKGKFQLETTFKLHLED